MKTKWKVLLKEYAVICLALALLFGAGYFAYAEYVKSTHTSRVVASFRKSQDRFTSNYLDKQTDSGVYNAQTIIASGSEASFVVYIYNHPRSLETLHYEDNINYTLTATLMVRDNTAQSGWSAATSGSFSDSVPNDDDPEFSNVTVAMTFNSNNTTDTSSFYKNGSLNHVFNGLLPGNNAAYDTLQVTFSNLPTDPTIRIPFYLELIAEPVPPENGSYPEDIGTLEGLIGVSHKTDDAASNWTGTMVETTDLSNYDGFNYLLQGSGNGTMKVLWDSSKLMLSEASTQFTLNDVGTITSGTQASGPHSSWSYIEFEVDSFDCSRYELQFYKMPDSSGWGSAIDYVFEPVSS